MSEKKLKKHTLLITEIIFVIVAIIIILTEIYNTDNGTDTSKREFKPISLEEVGILATKLDKAICVDEKYPSYYGGAYIKNQNLIILLTTRSKEAEKEIKEIVGQEEGVFIEYVKYSLNDLKNLQRKIGETYERLYEEEDIEAIQLLDDITRTHISEEYNEIVVGITDITNEKVKKLEKIFGNEDMIRYEEGGKNE